MVKNSTGGQKKVKKVRKEMIAGKLKSGRNAKKAMDRKQTIGIGLSKAPKQSSRLKLPKRKMAAE